MENKTHIESAIAQMQVKAWAEATRHTQTEVNASNAVPGYAVHELMIPGVNEKVRVLVATHPWGFEEPMSQLGQKERKEKEEDDANLDALQRALKNRFSLYQTIYSGLPLSEDEFKDLTRLFLFAENEDENSLLKEIITRLADELGALTRVIIQKREELERKLIDEKVKPEIGKKTTCCKNHGANAVLIGDNSFTHTVIAGGSIWSTLNQITKPNVEFNIKNQGWFLGTSAVFAGVGTAVGAFNLYGLYKDQDDRQTLKPPTSREIPREVPFRRKIRVCRSSSSINSDTPKRVAFAFFEGLGSFFTLAVRLAIQAYCASDNHNQYNDILKKMECTTTEENFGVEFLLPGGLLALFYAGWHSIDPTTKSRWGANGACSRAVVKSIEFVTRFMQIAGTLNGIAFAFQQRLFPQANSSTLWIIELVSIVPASALTCLRVLDFGSESDNCCKECCGRCSSCSRIERRQVMNTVMIISLKGILGYNLINALLNLNKDEENDEGSELSWFYVAWFVVSSIITLLSLKKYRDQVRIQHQRELEASLIDERTTSLSSELAQKVNSLVDAARKEEASLYLPNSFESCGIDEKCSADMVKQLKKLKKEYTTHSVAAANVGMEWETSKSNELLITNLYKRRHKKRKSNQNQIRRRQSALPPSSPKVSLANLRGRGGSDSAVLSSAASAGVLAASGSDFTPRFHAGTAISVVSSDLSGSGPLNVPLLAS